jgi:hypothetical protein
MSRHGTGNVCKECEKKRGRLWRTKNPEASRIAVRRWARKNRAFVKRRSREYNRTHVKEKKAWASKNKTRVSGYLLRYHLKRKYGITKEFFDNLMIEQNGKCGICNQPPSGKPRKDGRAAPRLHVDHDHNTGVIRGLLCLRCNAALERIDVVDGWYDKALSYLLIERKAA